ncbi:MAG TPA: TraR/DksA family transcriptional regulator [Bryobacteraceae bacterium]|nr:TraR/DksA family transcriptional regulator [Bryobacteraceae bacterium]
MKKRAPATAHAPTAHGNEAYRKQLLDKRTAVMSALGIKFDTLARMGRVNEEDQAQLTHDEFISLRLNSLDYGQLRLVNEALDRMDSGDYGICLRCEEAIPAKRLSALPWARYCVPCQELAGKDMLNEMPDAPGPMSGLRE